jgi:hypothetical protein
VTFVTFVVSLLQQPGALTLALSLKGEGREMSRKWSQAIVRSIK